jgi:hypothetical protein
MVTSKDNKTFFFEFFLRINLSYHLGILFPSLTFFTQRLYITFKFGNAIYYSIFYINYTLKVPKI